MGRVISSLVPGKQAGCLVISVRFMMRSQGLGERVGVPWRLQ